MIFSGKVNGGFLDFFSKIYLHVLGSWGLVILPQNSQTSFIEYRFFVTTLVSKLYIHNGGS
jgi:hypothetical protein